MFLGLLTLLTALTISSVAVYYSVSGLAAIFAGASIPIIIMGAALEIGKLVTASWLHTNWKRAPVILKTYLSVATIVLMFITSMGIFGFLSRAHIEQGAPIGDVTAQIELIDQKIQAKKSEITQAQTATKNLDDVVAQYLLKGKDEKSVAAANNARKNQQKERDKLAKQIDDAQKEISKLSEQKLPLTQKVRKIETEVGPIKYIAQFIYGDNANQDMLEKAVTWMILTIIFVFDPLAVLLLIASQISFGQFVARRKEKKELKEKQLLKEKQDKEVENFYNKEITPAVIQSPSFDEIVRKLDERAKAEENNNVPIPNVNSGGVSKDINHDDNTDIRPVGNDVVELAPQLPQDSNDTVPVVKPKKPKKIKKVFDETVMAVPTLDTLEEVLAEMKEEESKKKDLLDEVPVVYKQNSEQQENMLWHRILRSRNIFKPMDILYKEYAENGFRDINLYDQDQSDPDIQILIKYVEDVKSNNIKLDDIPIEYREKLADLITRER